MLYHLYGFDGKSMILYLWLDVFGGGMGWWLFPTKRDAYGDIYSLPFYLYGICIASHSLHWHMELCREPMVPTVPVQHRLLGMTWHCISLVLCFWDVRCMPWSMTLGDIGKKWYLTKDWWWLISSFLRLYYLIQYTLLFLFGSPAMEILKRCLMNL